MAVLRCSAADSGERGVGGEVGSALVIMRVVPGGEAVEATRWCSEDGGEGGAAATMAGKNGAGSGIGGGVGGRLS